MRSFKRRKNFLVGKAGPRKSGLAKLVADGEKKALGPILEFLKSGRGRMQARGERERFKKEEATKNDQAGEDLLYG